MERLSLQGRSILIVEDNPIIVIDITLALEQTGAQLTTTNTLNHALLLAEHDGLSAVILDHSLGDGDSTLLRKRLEPASPPKTARTCRRKAAGDFLRPLSI
jgi:DNA-binding response OmpR family regulator